MSGLLHDSTHELFVGQTVHTPHTAELAALLHALATAVNLPGKQCAIFYDATAAASIAQGEAASQREKVLVQALFSLRYMASLECQSLAFEHVQSRHPFNEAAGTAAKAIAEHGLSHTPHTQLFARVVREQRLDTCRTHARHS